MIDLRSDTVTQPTEAMKRAMMAAPLGDAVIDVDPTVEKLERRTAEILGKEAAVFMPSGSMTNQIAVRVHCERGAAFICESDCHIFHYEQGAFAGLSGLVARTIAGQNGELRVEHVRDQLHAENDHAPRTQLLCLENTHNRWGGKILDQSAVIEICDWSHQNGLQTHLDGARLWNAAIATGTSERELAEPFDSVSVCFSKGLGAPVGSALAGTEAFVQEARRARKLFGGGMRQAGVIAGAALYALEHHRERLSVDHDHARQIGDAVEASSALKLRRGTIDTNIVAVEIDPSWGTANEMVDKLAQRDISCFDIGKHVIRLVTHLDATSEQIDTACQTLKALAR